MKILAIEKELKIIERPEKYRILEIEAKAVYELYSSGCLRELFFNEKHNAVLILESESIEAANKLLATLPLVEKGLIAFEVMELNPYTGFERIMK